jgi:hypothetical protein
MRIKATVASLLVGFALCSMSPPAHAGTTPTSFTFQGVLRNNAGALQSLQFDVFVNLWTAQTGGTELKSYGQVVVAENGVFSVTVSDTTLPALLAANASLWVEVSAVGFGTFPRQSVTADLYAMQSGTSESLSCTGCVGMQHLSLPSGEANLSSGSGTANVTLLAPAFTPTASGTCLVFAGLFGVFNHVGDSAKGYVTAELGTTQTNSNTFVALLETSIPEVGPLPMTYPFAVTAGQSTQFGCFFQNSATAVDSFECQISWLCF